MTKLELLKDWQEALRNGGVTLSHAQCDTALKTLCESLIAGLRNDSVVSLPGIGKLCVKETKARTGRNPQTGQALTIPAGKKVALVVSKDLKERLKG